MQTNSKLEYQLEVLKMLAILLELGFPLSVAIEIMGVKFDVKNWQTELQAGNSFYHVLEVEGFDRDVLLIIKIGLDSENFQSTVEKAIEIINSKIEKRGELIELFKYPIMLMVIAILSIAFVSYFLLPQFEKILGSMGVESTATTILYQMFRVGPYLISILVLILAVIGVFVYRLSYEQRLRLLVKVKPVRKIYISIYNQVFAVTLSNLLKTNLHLSSVITVLTNQTENRLLADESSKIEAGLQAGMYIADSVTELYYDPQLLYILKLGEESGMLIYYLDSYSKLISAANQNRGRRIVFWIQPIFYLTFGVLILLLYAAIFIPMFALMDSI